MHLQAILLIGCDCCSSSHQ